MTKTVRGYGLSATPLIRFVLAVCLVALPLGTALAGVTVTLTAPTNGAVFTAGSNITLSATASATQGYTVSKVEFFRGGTTLIGTDTSSPYSITWTNVPAGAYTLTAKATAIKKNNPDQTATSTAVSITVNALPSVSLTSPAGGAVYAAPGSMTLTATASDADGTISKVEFFHGGTNLIATVTSSPYTYNWNGVAAGSYSLTAKATDNLSGSTTSSPVAVTVTNAPTVMLTSPANNATFSAPASVTLTATASDSDGSIQKVEFFHGGTNLIATVTSPPYTYAWTNVGAGNYALTAKATDNLGIATTSTPANITVVGLAPAGLYFIHVDNLGTPRAIYNDQQQLAWRWEQAEPFGVSAPDENPIGVGTFEFPLRFPGQYADKETNLNYNYFRDYDPAIGRYPQSDPIGLAGGINTYAYVGSNPLSLTDPFGLAESGPYHPQEGVSLRCTQADTCPQIQGKMQVLERMIRSHEGWDRNNPPPRGGGRHATEIAELWRAYARCQAIWEKKCVDCPPEENAFSKWWRSLTDPRPKPVPDPAEELFGQNPRRQIPGAPGGAAGPSTTPPIRILP